MGQQCSTYFLSEKDINIRFSNLEYRDIAPDIGLGPLYSFSDAPLFDLYRSRIPTSLFKKIVKDIDVSLIHYGALNPRLGDNQLTEEARSRILAPVSLSNTLHRFFLKSYQIFGHLVAQFGGYIHNITESFMSGRITRDRVDYHFKTIGLITVVFMELPSGGDHLNAIFQVIEECNGKASL